MTSIDSDYRFLKDGEIIEATDEYNYQGWVIGEEVWCKTSITYVGKRYSSFALVPLRRRVEKTHPADVF